MTITKHHEELAAEVRRYGTIKERQEFQLGGSFKTSTVYVYEGKRYYITMTDGQITYFHEGGSLL